MNLFGWFVCSLFVHPQIGTSSIYSLDFGNTEAWIWGEYTDDADPARYHKVSRWSIQSAFSPLLELGGSG